MKLTTQNRPSARAGLWLALVSMVLVFSAGARAQNADFSVTVNTGPTPPNADTIYPGQATSLRLTLSNNSTTIPLTGVNFNKALPSTATAGLRVNGASAINGTGCGGALATAIGQPGIDLSGLTVPVRVDGVPGSGECYLDIPITGISQNGASTSLSYALNTGEVSSDQGTNATGGPQAITLRPVARPTWSKSFVGGSVMTLGGASRTLRINVQNPDDNISLNNIGFTDVMPVSGAGGAIIEPTGAPASGSCVASNGAIVGLVGGAAGSITVAGIDLAPNASCVVDVAVRARHTNGNYEVTALNRIPTTSFTSDEGLRPASDATQNATARSPLAVGKVFSPGIMASGVDSTVTITLTNAGLSALPVSLFTDNPIGVAGATVGLNIANAGNVVNSCGGNVTLLNGGEGFQIDSFNIPASSNCTVTVTFSGITPAADQPTTYTNQIAQGAVQVAGQPGIISQARSATVIVADRLRVLKSATPSVVEPGNPVRYQLTVQNFADSAVANVTVADTLQNGSTLLTGAGYTPGLTPACGALGLNGAVQGDSELLFTIPTLPARTGVGAPGQCTITFWAMVGSNSTGNTANQIASNAVCIGGNPLMCNQGASNNVSTGSRPIIVFNKTFNAANNLSLPEGQAARLRLRLDNYSINPLGTVTFSDTLPSAGPFQQLRIASPANISNSCGGAVTAIAGETSLALNNGSIAALVGATPGSCQVEVDVVGPAGVYPNTADAAGEQTMANGVTRTVNASDDATLTYSDILASSKNFSPAEVGPGGRSTVRVGFTNLSPNRPITGIAVADSLPAGMLVASPANAYTTCAGAASISAPEGGSAASLSGATLAPGSNCALLFDVVVSGTGSPNWVNTIAPGQITADGGLTNRDPVAATLLYVEPPVPLISKAISPGAIVPGQSARLTINITNGADALSNLRLSDYFTDDGLVTGAANGMVIAPSPQASTNCPGGVVVATPGSASVAVSGVNLAANQLCRVEVMVTSTTVGTITNTIPLNTIETDQGASNSTTFAQTTLSTVSNPGVSKQFIPAVVSPNEVARLRITFFNPLAGSLNNFSITDAYPAGLVTAADPVPFSDCGGGVAVTYDAGSVTLTGGSLGPAINGQASSCYVDIGVEAAVEGTYLNVIPANSLVVNGTPVTHPETEAALEVRERLIVNKAIGGLTLDVGDPVGFTTGTASRRPGVPAPLVIRLENPNDIPVTQVTFTDDLPDGLVIANVPNLVTDCTNASVAAVSFGRQVVLTGATLAASGSAGAICNVQVDVLSNTSGVYTNEIPGEAVTSFEGISNLEPTQAQIIISEPGTIAKDFAPPVVAPGVASQLSIVIGNDNDLAMTLTAALVDNLPASPSAMVVATPNNIGTDCPGGPPIVTAAAGSATVQINNGAVIPPGGCVVTVDVTAPDPGTYDNNIPVGALQTSFGPNEEPASAPLLVSTLGYISGKVFLDNQPVPDGAYLPGQSTPITGNTIELHNAANCSDPSPVVLQTDAQGNYLFSGLSAGTYSVCQPSQPPTTLNSVTVPGTIVPYNGSGGNPGAASNPPAGIPTSQIIGIVLTNSGVADEVSGSPNNNFSEVLPASVAGNVYHDSNNNGVFDPGESGIGGVLIELSGPVMRSVLTAADGSYSFSGLPPGTYTVTETQPSGWVDGMDAAGSVGGDASVSDVISSITLAPADAAVNYNFGEVLAAGLNVTANAYCQNDAPYASYNLEDFGGAAAPRVTVTWITEGGRVAATLPNQPASGAILWPGAAVDSAGEGVAWPGWAFVDDEWVAVPDDRVPAMTLRITVGAVTGEVDLIYPLSSPGCQAQPPGTYTPHAIPASPPWALVGMVMLMLATALSGLYRRRFYSGS